MGDMIDKCAAVEAILSKLESLDDKSGQEWLSTDTANWHYKEIAAMMTALPSVTVGVKPLVWDGENGFGAALPDKVSYIVIDESGEYDYCWELTAQGAVLKDSGGMTWGSVNEARNAANGHYTRTAAQAFIAALEPSPAPKLAEALELLKNAERLICEGRMTLDTGFSESLEDMTYRPDVISKILGDIDEGLADLRAALAAVKGGK
jgi:hypothetical protein